MVLYIFLEKVYLKGSNFAFGVKASRVFALSIFLFSLFDYFELCNFLMILFVFGWHCSFDLLVT